MSSSGGLHERDAANLEALARVAGAHAWLRERGHEGSALQRLLVDEVVARLSGLSGSASAGVSGSGCEALDALDWRRVSPDILGSIVELTMDAATRRDAGAHYTSEANILRVLDPLVLDELRATLAAAKGSRARLEALWDRLAALRVLDPACGCGNFLIVAYRELRVLERELMAALGVEARPRVGMHQFVGIEIDEFAAEVARVALRIAAAHDPGQDGLGDGPTIVQGNALALDWATLVPGGGLTHVVGNPPFVGKKAQSSGQKRDMQRVFAGLRGAGTLDLAAAWFMIAARLAVTQPELAIAFVSTNSIVQGEQVAVLWGELARLGMHVAFAHRSFAWRSAATERATVQCVIVGFGRRERAIKRLFEYDDPRGEPRVREVGSINAYLVEGPNVVIQARATPIGEAPRARYGSFALDDGHYTLSAPQREALLAACPAAARFLRPFVGGEELLHGRARWCLWLESITPEELAAMPELAARVERVAAWRAASGRASTRALAATPTRFAEVRQPATRYLAFPTLSSEHRPYVPIAFLEPEVIASNQVYVFEGATNHEFGVLTSAAHMTWIRAVCGRLEGRYRYSTGIVYNNFPWPTPSPEQREAIERAAAAVLAARAAATSQGNHEGVTLAWLYDRRTMPNALRAAHRELDAAVDAAYGLSTGSEAERAAVLFERAAGRVRADIR